MSKIIKQVILIRRDLRLKKASIAAMAAKMSSKFIFDNNLSERSDILQVELTLQEAEWLAGPETRIVLGVSSENALKSLVFKAELAGLSCCTLTSASQEEEMKNDFMEEVICASIGPDEAEKIDEITGNLRLI